MRKKKDGPEETDREIWLKVASTVKPYARARGSAPPPVSTPRPASLKTETGSRQPRAKEQKRGSGSLPPPPPVPSARGFDAATARRLKRGQMEIEGRIDLHGLSRAQAQDALARFVSTAARRGARTLLVVTGKSGVLRRLVPEWLRDLPGVCLACVPARPKDGGDGALYVRLRRPDRGR